MNPDTARREEVEVDEPMFSMDRQMGLNVVHPKGKVGADLEMHQNVQPTQTPF